MKGIFVYYNKIELDRPTGIDKKVLTQIKVFNSQGFKCKIFNLTSGVTKNRKRTLYEKIKYRLPGSNIFPKWEYNEEFNNNDFIYFRRPPCITGYTIKTLKRIKEKNPNTKIIMEIPTYPYDKELKMTLKDYPIFLKDSFNRKKLKNIVDRIALISGNEINELFGVPVLRLFNGIDLSSINIRKSNYDESINLCAVAMFSKWHGYDRIIYGLSEYYKSGGKRSVKLHLIGEGAEIQTYQDIVKNNNLEEIVTFYGMKSGQELDEIYDRMDIGLDVFGMYRKNLSIAYSLKSREYLAKGLPVISGCSVDVFENHSNFKYYLEVENNSTPVDIQRIVDFYDRIYLNKNGKQEVIDEIREFSEKTCDITESMKNVLDYIKFGMSVR